MATPEQIRKLPAWAREEIRNAEGRARVAERRLSDLQASQTKTRVAAGDVWDNPLYLSDDYMRGRVRFGLADDELNNHITIGLSKDKTKLYLTASRRLVIEMDASNTCTLRLKED